MAAERLRAVGQVAGTTEGQVVRLAEPVSFWGGVGRDGTVSDVRHPDRGVGLAGRVLVTTSGRGSSSSSSVLAELIHAGVGPAAIVTSTPDAILVLGALVPALLYGEEVPVVVLPPEDLDRLATGTRVRVVALADGEAWVDVLS
jgi:predicted aconitase with swiveling domain